MTTFARDSLADQIIRGEIFYAYIEPLAPRDGSTGSNDDWAFAIDTGASNCSAIIFPQSNTLYSMSVHADVTSYSGGTTANSYNMNYESANTISTTVTFNVNTRVGGTWKGTFYNKPSMISTQPFVLENGIVLAPNTKNYFLFTNLDASRVWPSFVIFLREGV